MTTVRQILRRHADLHGVQFWMIEKDYALSYLLKAISTTEDLGDTLVLKGGTALRKLYFGDYRFSEDLDFSTRKIGPIAGLDTKKNTAMTNAEGLLKERGPFRIEVEPLALRDPHPEGQSSYVIHVQFPYHRQPVCRLKVEITVDEPILLDPEDRSVLHAFPEIFIGNAIVYQLKEIIAEKLRALLQSLRRIEDRGWGTGRICRDYYDLWYLLKNVEISGEELIDLAQKKSAHRDVGVESVGDFFSPALQDIARRQWQKQLLIFVPTAPEVELVLYETRNILEKMWG